MNFVDNSLNVLQDIQSDIYKILDQRMSQETAIKSAKRGVLFGDVSVSVFTITIEDTQKSPTLTNTLRLDSGVQTVPSMNSRNNVEDGPKSVSSVSMPVNRSLEEEFFEEEDEKCRRQQRVKQRPEKATWRLKLRRRSLNRSLNESDEIMTSRRDSLKISCRSKC